MRYPIYIPSRGRPHCITPITLKGMPFKIMVEPQEEEAYAGVHGADRVITLPEAGKGLAYSRTMIKRYSQEQGEAKHWQLDDDLTGYLVWRNGGREKIPPDDCFTYCETFVDRYTNIGVAGMMHSLFGYQPTAPFKLNVQCPTSVLVDNSYPFEWRTRVHQDTDYALQVLVGGYCTVLFQMFQFDTVTSGLQQGGQTDEWESGGREQGVKDLAALWPGLGIKIQKKRNGRVSAYTAHLWRKFDTPLIRKDAP